MGKNTNQIATGDDFYTTGAYIRAWNGLTRCPTRGEAAAYLGIATTPANKCIKYSDWTTKQLSTNPTYYVEINGDGSIIGGTIDKYFDSVGFSLSGYVAHWRWDASLNDDVFVGWEYTNQGYYTGTKNTSGGGFSYTGGNYGYDTFGSFYPEVGTYSITSNGYKYTFSIQNVTIPSSSSEE